jgi:hypothetical protein
MKHVRAQLNALQKQTSLFFFLKQAEGLQLLNFGFSQPLPLEQAFTWRAAVHFT